MADYEEAKRCPKCQQPGDKVSEHSAGPEFKPGTKAHIIMCRNELCRWYDTTWVVQVRPDGTVPDPQILNRQKNYPDMPVDQEVLDEYLQSELDAQRHPGGEIPR